MAEENQATGEAADGAAEAAEKPAPPEPTPEEKAKRAVKERIRALRSARDDGRGDWTQKQLNRNRRDIHRLRRQLRKLSKAAS